jgi:hypothetical protein
VALRELLFDPMVRADLAQEACGRALPTWSAAAAFLRSSLEA